MVRLSFVQYAPAPLPEVWNYFSKFQNIADWDPNTKRITPKSSNAGQVGSTYTIVTLWKGEQSELNYRLTSLQKYHRMSAQGENSTTTVVDQITFKQKDKGTQITYVADISLKHVLKIFTPFIKSDLQKLRDDAQKGMKTKINQLWKS